MAIQMKIGSGKFYLFRHEPLQTKYLVISSHGEAIAGQEAWSPNFKTTMQNPDSGMPIALWLLHEENKDKTMMTVKK